MQIKSKHFAFTLIELLVVMAIIGILAGMSLFALAGSRESARDARRKADLEKIRSGIELYKADCGGYPAGGGDFYFLFGTGGFLGSEGGCGGGNTNTYIQDVPQDPVSGGLYIYGGMNCPVSLCATYELCADLEGGGAGVDCGTTNIDNCGSGANTCNYQVINP